MSHSASLRDGRWIVRTASKVGLVLALTASTAWAQVIELSDPTPVVVVVSPGKMATATVTVSGNFFTNAAPVPVTMTIICCSSAGTVKNLLSYGVSATVRPPTTVTVAASAPTQAVVVEISASNVWVSYGIFSATLTASATGVSDDQTILIKVEPPVEAVIQLVASPGDSPELQTKLPPGSSVVSRIAAQAANLPDGILPLALSASCCTDVLTGNPVALNGVGIQLPMLSLNGASSTGAELTISSTGATPFGKFVVSIVAENPDLGIRLSSRVGFRMLPSDGEPAPACRKSTTVIPMRVPVEARIDEKEGLLKENNDRVSIIVYSPPNGIFDQVTDVWRWDIKPDPGLPPDEAIVELLNRTRAPQEVTTEGCSSHRKRAVVMPNRGGVIHIKKSEDRTIIFRKCRRDLFHKCVSGSWTDAAVLAESAFWTAFGGKQISVAHLYDAHDYPK